MKTWHYTPDSTPPGKCIIEMLRDCTNRSRPSSRGTSVKALVSGRTSEGTAKELSALSSALRFCREETKVSLTKLARLTKASGISEDAIETLKIRIKDFAEQKNNVLDELDLEVDSLREGFDLDLPVISY